MTYRLNPFLTFGCALAGLLLLATGATLSRQSTHAQSAIMRVDPPSRTVDVAGGKFTVRILIDNVSNLGSYEFELKFDPAILRVVGVGDAGFLGSSGRQVHCPGAILESSEPDKPADTLRYGCATRDPTPAGPDGSGALATVTFAPRAAGVSPLSIVSSSSITGITDVSGNPISVDSESGSVAVVGDAPPATAEPDEPTPIPTRAYIAPVVVTPTPGGDWMLTPDPGETPMSRPMPGREMVRRSGDTATNASDTGSGAGSSSNSPRAGTGPEQERSSWPALAGGLLVAGGAGLLFVSFYLQQSRKRPNDRPEL